MSRAHKAPGGAHIRLFHDWLLVQIDPAPTQHGGLFVLADSPLNTVRTGTIVATGPGRYAGKTHKRVPLGVEVGEKVAFFRWHLEHKTGKQITSLIEGFGKDLGLIRVPDVLFAYPASEEVKIT